MNSVRDFMKFSVQNLWNDILESDSIFLYIGDDVYIEEPTIECIEPSDNMILSEQRSFCCF